MACLQRANDARQVKAIEAEISRLNTTWNPTGYYRPADVRLVINTLATAAEQAGAVLAGAPLSTATARNDKNSAVEDVRSKFGDQARYYEQSIAAATKSGVNVIDAPNLKRWVISSMQSIANVYVTASVLHCRQSWLESVLDKAYKAMAGVGSVVYRIVGVAVKVGEAVIEAVETSVGIAAVVIKYAPYGFAALVGYVGYQYMKKRL